MQSEYRKKLQSRNDKVITYYQSLLNEGTPVMTARSEAARKFNVTPMTVYRICK